MHSWNSLLSEYFSYLGILTLTEMANTLKMYLFPPFPPLLPQFVAYILKKYNIYRYCMNVNLNALKTRPMVLMLYIHMPMHTDKHVGWYPGPLLFVYI